METLDASTIDDMRESIRRHFANGGKVSELGVEGFKPESGLSFALIARTPPAPTRDRWYRCSYCQRNLQFKAGTIVLCEDRCLRLIGDDCWELHFDHALFVEARESLRLFELRKIFGELRAGLVVEVAECERRVRWQLRKINELKKAEAFASRLSTAIPILWQSLNNAKRAGGVLVVERALTAREMDLRQGSKPIQDKYERVTIHRPQGVAFIEPHNVSESLERSLNEIQAAQKTLEQTNWDKLTIHEFGSKRGLVVSDLKKALGSMVAASTFVDQARQFCAPTNLDGLSRWGDDVDCELRRHGILVIGREFIEFQFNTGKVERVDLPRCESLPSIPSVRKLRSLVSRAK